MTAGIVDFLDPIPADVAVELRGLAREQDRPEADLEAMKIWDCDHVVTWEEQVDFSAGDPMQYHRQTVEVFLEALSFEPLPEQASVLEVGGEKTFPLLQRCRADGHRCYAANIFFERAADGSQDGWPQRVLCDMHDLPFDSAMFDLVIVSATAHHSPDLRRLFTELGRVVAPGGRILLLTEMVSSPLKRLGGRGHHVRDGDIHEEEISYLTYRRAIAAAGLRYRGFLPDHFVRRLTDPSALDPNVRFAYLARPLGRLWARFPRTGATVAAACLPLAQSVLGFPLNAELRRSGRPRRVGPAQGSVVTTGAQLEGRTAPSRGHPGRARAG